MMRSTRTACRLALGVALSALPTLAAAQAPVLGFAGGLAIPTGRYDQSLNVGFNFSVMADLHPVPGPFAFRGDVLWSRFGVTGTQGTGSSNIVGGGLDVLLNVPIPGLITPYALAGAGVYDVESGFSFDHRSRFGVGLNGGGGVRFLVAPLVHLFVEARYEIVYASPFGGNATFIPIVAGIRLH